jgi:hypothetical protein
VVLSSTSSGTEALPFASTLGPTGARGRHDDDGALPFQSSHAAAPSAASDAKPIGTETAAFDSGSLLAAAEALPFARPREQLPFPVVAPAIVPVRPPDPLEQRRPPATAEPSPEPAVRAAASPPLAREPELSLALYARVRVALLDDRRGLTAALRGSGVEERRYLLHDRRMTIALAHEESEGKSELRRELEQAMAAARSARAEPQPPHEMTVREYAELRAEVEEAREPARALSDLGLSKGAYAALRRRWTKRCLLDPQLAAELRDALQTARRSLRRVDDSNIAED